MAKANILIVEDEVILAKELQTKLQGMGYKIISVVNSGEKAIERADQDRPDLILMDIKLKGRMDGIEAADHIRSHFTIPVIFLTAYADEEKLERAKLTTPFGYILKPYQDRDLEVTIEMALYIAHVDAERRRAEEALKKAHDELEQKVKERTLELVNANDDLKQEINERKRAEEQLLKSKTMLQAVFDGISEPLFMVDKDLRIEVLNRSAAEYYKTEYHDTVGKPCYQSFNGRSEPCEMCEVPSAVLNAEFASIERKGFKDPQRIEKVFVYPLREKDRKTGSAIIRLNDVTEEKRMEQELMQADKMISLGVLVSGVAHEINNPNNFIMLNTPLLMAAWESIVPVLEKHYEGNGDFNTGGLPYSEMRHEVPRLFKGMEEGSNRIKRIVQDLKDYARPDIGEMNQSVDVNAVIKHTSALLHNLIKRSTNNFSIKCKEDLPLIKGNSQKLEQVVINLIQNACQALPDGEKGIFVKSSYDDETGDIVIEVRDEGTGIPDESLSHIMDPFFTTRRSDGGTGLGLSVSANIVKDHGGRIEVESQRKKGTTFRVILPITGKEELLKILIVDDHDKTRGVLKAAFKKERGYLVREASRGTEACVKLGSDCPDLLILDIQMPDMDGVEVCRLIKESPELSGVKVIIITGFPNSSKAEEIAEMGFKIILPKPLSIPGFLETVDKVLKGGQSEGSPTSPAYSAIVTTATKAG